MERHEFPLQYTRPKLSVANLDRYRVCRMTVKEMTSITESFAELGVICLRDSQVTDARQRAFRRTMTEIHGASPEEREAMNGADTGFQFGLTPPNTEYPLDHSKWVATLPPEHRPLTIPGRADPKARFMWAIGTRPQRSLWPKVNVGSKIPQRFASIAEPLSTYGQCLLDAACDITEIVATGLGLERERFSKMLRNGPHILGPTGSDFTRAKLSTVLAGLHYDFNLITVHGQTDIRALVCWTRDGKPFLVEVPDGCLLAQAGKSLEWMTGGYFFAGKHEVIVTPESLADRDTIIAREERPIRVSSNLFVHLATNVSMRPVAGKTDAEALDKYPSVFGGDYQTIELVQINLFEKAEIERCKALGPRHERMINRALQNHYAS